MKTVGETVAPGAAFGFRFILILILSQATFHLKFPLPSAIILTGFGGFPSGVTQTCKSEPLAVIPHTLFR